MKTKLNQLIAVAQGKKANAKKVEEKAYHLFQKEGLFNGQERVFVPNTDAEDAEKLPAEKVVVQQKVGELVGEVKNALIEMLDVVYSQDKANTVAQADVIVEDKVVLSSVPVTSLLFLEKQLVDLHTFVNKMPVLDPAQDWKYDNTKDLYRTDAEQTNRMIKKQVPITLYEATEEHPAQTQLVTKDILSGQWKTVKTSGAIDVQRKNQLLERIRLFKDAVVLAREEANTMEVTNHKIGATFVKHIFGE